MGILDGFFFGLGLALATLAFMALMAAVTISFAVARFFKEEFRIWMLLRKERNERKGSGTS